MVTLSFSIYLLIFNVYVKNRECKEEHSAYLKTYHHHQKKNKNKKKEEKKEVEGRFQPRKNQV